MGEMKTAFPYLPVFTITSSSKENRFYRQVSFWWTTTVKPDPEEFSVFYLGVLAIVPLA